MTTLIQLAKRALCLHAAASAPAHVGMIRDHGAFKRRLKTGTVLETRDGPTMESLSATIEKIGRAVETMRQKNEDAIQEIKTKGAIDPTTADTLKKQGEEIAELRTLRESIEDLRKKVGRPGLGKGAGGQEVSAESKEHRSALLQYLRQPNSRKAQERLEIAESKAIKADEANSQEFETRAVGTTTDAAGGYAVPEQIATAIQAELLEISPLRNLVNVVTVGTKDYKELVDKKGMAYGWVGETDSRTETGTPTLAEVAPTFGTLYAYPKATEESLQDMFFDVEGWLSNSAVEAFAAGEENAIVNGNGTNKPTGFLSGTPVVTADGARAFGVLQFIATGQAATWKAYSAGVTSPFDTFQETIYQLKKGYRSNARWLMNKSVAGALMLFKNADNNYLWQQSLLEGQPDRLMGYAVSESEEMPDVAANAFPVAFGDFKAGYTLADLAGLRITRDDITTPGYVKWYIRRRLGGKIRMSEAIKLIKIAA